MAVSDWYCRGDVIGVGREEEAPTWELSIGRTGSHAVRTGEGELIVGPLHMLCVNAGDVFRPVRRALGLDRRTRISLDMSLLHELVPHRRGHAAPRFPRRTALLTPRTALLHHRLLLHTGVAERDELAVHALSLELAAHALGVNDERPLRTLSLSTAPAASHQLRDAIHAVQEILARRFAEPLTLTQLADTVALSPWHLSRSFRAQVGLGVHRYRTRLRLLAALERMRDELRPDLSRLAFEVGFSSHSHFTREVRGFLGTPPTRLSIS